MDVQPSIALNPNPSFTGVAVAVFDSNTLPLFDPELAGLDDYNGAWMELSSPAIEVYFNTSISLPSGMALVGNNFQVGGTTVATLSDVTDGVRIDFLTGASQVAVTALLSMVEADPIDYSTTTQYLTINYADGSNVSPDQFDGLNISIDIDPSNIAPTLFNPSISYEQSDNVGGGFFGAAQSVGELLADGFAGDSDGDTLGIAISDVASITGGTWQYSTDGGTTFNDIVLADGQFLLLDEGALVYYLPDSAETVADASIVFHAWDQSDSQISGATVTPVELGRDTAISYQSTVVDVALVSDLSPHLIVPSTVSYDAAPAYIFGATALLDPEFKFSDNYSGAEVFIEANYYGTVAFDPSAVSSLGLTYEGTDVKSGGIVIASLTHDTSLDKYTLAFTDANGAIPSQQQVDEILSWLTFELSDPAEIFASINVYSSDGFNLSDSLTVSFDNQINFAPTSSNTPADIEQVFAADTPSAGEGATVDSIIQELFVSDSNDDPLSLAIESYDSGEGTWFYSLDGASYQALPTINAGDVLLLAPDSLLYYEPGSAETSSTAALGVRVWDQSDMGSVGDVVTLTGTGGHTAFSDAVDTVTVNLVADLSPELNTFNNIDYTGEPVALFDTSGSRGALYDEELDNLVDGGDYTGASVSIDTFDGVVGFASGASIDGLIVLDDQILENGNTIATLDVQDSVTTVTFVNTNGDYADHQQANDILSIIEFDGGDASNFSSAFATINASDGNDASSDTSEFVSINSSAF